MGSCNPSVDTVEGECYGESKERIITEITNIKHQEIMSVSGNSKLCKKCAYYDLCTI